MSHHATNQRMGEVMLHLPKQRISNRTRLKMQSHVSRAHRFSLREQLAREQAAVYKRALRRGKQPRVHIEVDEEMGFFQVDKITIHERSYLLRKDYAIAYRQNIHGKRAFYLIKPRGNESVDHFFLVKDIERYLKRFFTVWLYHSVRPDVVFEFKNRKIAIEVETGKTLKTNKKSLLEKVEVLNDQYGSDWFFVVTNRAIAKKYRQFGKTYTRQTILKKLKTFVANKPKKKLLFKR